MADLALQHRNEQKRPVSMQAPSGIQYITNRGAVFNAATQEDYEWLLSLRMKTCGCGGGPKPNGKGDPIYQPAP